MPEALIIDAVRTPIGKRGKALRDMHPVDLLGQHIAALLARTGVDPIAIDDVIAGCVGQSPISRATPGLPPVCPNQFRRPQSTGSVDRVYRRSISLLRGLWQACTTW